MTITIYGMAASPFVRKVRVVLTEKELDYTLEQVNIFPPPDWFVEISPAKRIPVMRDTSVAEDFTLPDSGTICAYLERKYPDTALYPGDAAAFGKALWFEKYVDTELASQIGMGVFRPIIVGPMMSGGDPDTEKAEKTMTEVLPAMFDYLEKEILGKEYFVDGRFTIADIAVATQFVNLRHAGYTPDAASWPNLAAFIDRMHARPSFAACIEEERPFFKATSIA